MKNIKQFFFIFPKHEVSASIGVKFMHVISLVLFHDKNFIDATCCFAGTLLSTLIDGSLTSSEKIFLKSKSLGSLREVIEIYLCQENSNGAYLSLLRGTEGVFTQPLT